MVHTICLNPETQDPCAVEQVFKYLYTYSLDVPTTATTSSELYSVCALVQDVYRLATLYGITALRGHATSKYVGLLRSGSASADIHFLADTWRELFDPHQPWLQCWQNATWQILRTFSQTTLQAVLLELVLTGERGLATRMLVKLLQAEADSTPHGTIV